MKRISSIKKELIKKSREAMLAAVQIYNNPQMTFKSEAFISLATIAWTYLMHAYYRGEGIDYRYYKKQGNRKKFNKTKYGAFKQWELETCLKSPACPLDKDTINNLNFLIGIRHEIEHQMTTRLDEYISAKLQACAINFDYYITNLFGFEYAMSDELALAIQFSPITPGQEDQLNNNEHIITNVRNFITEFEDGLDDDQFMSSRYAYRVLFVPISAKRKSDADKVIEFISPNSKVANDIETTYTLLKETEKPKFLPNQIVKLMREKGFSDFNISKHTHLWKSKDAKNKKYNYGVGIANQWYWYQNWVEEVERHLKFAKTKER